MQHTSDFLKKSSSSKPLVFYLSYDGILDPVGRSQILPYLLELQRDLHFILVSYEKDFNSTSFHQMRTFLAQTSILWFPIKFDRKIPILSTLLNLIKGRKLTSYIFSRYPIAVAHARSYVAAWILYHFIRKYNTPFVFDMRGFWVDERIDGHIWKKNFFTNILYTYFKNLEQKFIHHSSHIISLTHVASQWMQKNWNVKHEKISVIPCCTSYISFDPSLINNEEANHLRDTLLIPERSFILGYIGSTGTWYLIDEMIDFFKELKKQRQDAYFLLVVNHIDHLVKQKILSENSIVLVERVPYHLIPMYIHLMDAVIMFIKPAFSKIASSPIKMAEAFAMNKPVIINQNIGDTKLIEEYQLGIIVKELSKDSYRDAAMKLIHSSFKDIRSISRTYFDITYGSKMYFRVYQSLMHQS